jgi:hypothetical protein
MYGIPCLSNEICSGTEIDSLDGKCCLGTCTPLDAQNKDCALDLSGQICYPEACVDTSNWQVITPIKSQDSSYCCISNGIIKCVLDKTCGEISGQKCPTGERCSIDTEETKDEEICCTGECLKECSSLGGNLCGASEKCSGGIMQDSYEGNNVCCVDGTCKKQTNLTWVWIILIVLVIGGGGFALYWFKFRKKGEGAKKPGEKQSPFGNLFGRPTLQQKQTTRTTTSTTFQQPGIVRPSSVQQTPRTTQPIQPRKVSKTKTDEELEKTLKKLKSMTKEKKK